MRNGFTKKSSMNRIAAEGKTFKGSTCSKCGRNERYTKTARCTNCYMEAGQVTDFGKRKKQLLDRIKAQAKIRGVEFNISVDDVVWNTHCPIFGFELNYWATNARERDTASFDRKNSSMGYVKGNVSVISNKANSCKSNMTTEEIERLLIYAKTYNED